MALPNISSFPQNGSIVSRWKLDETSGTRSDSVSSNDLTDNNTVLYQAGQFDENAADMERDNTEFLSVADGDQSGLHPSANFTVSMWLKPESVPTALMGLAQKDGGTNEWRIFYRDSSGVKIQVDYFDSSSNETQAELSQTLTAGVWYHMTFVFDVSGSDISIYIDGVDQSATMTDTAASSVRDSGGDFRLGSHADSHGYDGLMQDVIFWSTDLTASEVEDLYNAYFSSGVSLVGIERTPIRGIGRGICRP